MNIASLYTSSVQQQSSVYTPRDRLMVGRDIAPLSEPAAERKKTDTLVISDFSREAFFTGQHKQQRIEEYAFDGLTMSFENVPDAEKDSLPDGTRMLVLKEGGREVARLAYDGKDARLSKHADGTYTLVSGKDALENGVLRATQDGDILLRSSAGKVDNGSFSSTLVSLGSGPLEVKGGSGNNNYLGVYSEATIQGGEGSNRFDGFFTNSVLQGGAGKNTFSGSYSGAEVTGGGADDAFSGVFLNKSVLKGLGGDDSFSGFFFNSRLEGGEGNDRVSGNMDYYEGEQDKKMLAPSIVNTFINLGEGDDVVEGVMLDSAINLGAGDNTARGLYTNSSVLSGQGKDNVSALFAENSHFDLGAGDDSVSLKMAFDNNILSGAGENTVQLGGTASDKEFLYNADGRRLNVAAVKLERFDKPLGYGSHEGNAVDASLGEVSLTYATKAGMQQSSSHDKREAGELEASTKADEQAKKLEREEAAAQKAEQEARQQQMEALLELYRSEGSYSIGLRRQMEARYLQREEASQTAIREYGSYRTKAFTAVDDGLGPKDNKMMLGDKHAQNLEGYGGIRPEADK